MKRSKCQYGKMAALKREGWIKREDAARPDLPDDTILEYIMVSDGHVDRHNGWVAVNRLSWDMNHRWSIQWYKVVA